jgi:hypothetical protein
MTNGTTRMNTSIIMNTGMGTITTIITNTSTAG